MNISPVAVPWSNHAGLYSSPTGVVVKMRLGEAPARIPPARAVQLGLASAPSTLGVAGVDRTLSHFTYRARVTRVHAPAQALRFDDIEQVTGLARTFRIDLAEGCAIGDLVDALRNVHEVESVAPRYLCAVPFAAPAVIGTDVWSAAELVHAEEAMAYESGDPAVVVAICDTGVASAHPELIGRLRPGLDTVQLGVGELSAGLRLMGDSAGIDLDPEDEVGHGTACAAIIGARGGTVAPGLAGACGILPVRVLGAATFPGKTERVGLGAISDIDAGVKRAIDIGARVINMSFGTPSDAVDGDDLRPHEDVVRYGLARGCVLVAASGNTGREERFLPAALDGVIAVGATTLDGSPAGFSTRGDHVALSGPGQRVITASLDGTAAVTGTSFASPFVAAAAALLVSRAHRRAVPLSGAAVGELLRATASPFGDDAPTGYGAGVLNAAAALRALDAAIDSAESGHDVLRHTQTSHHLTKENQERHV